MKIRDWVLMGALAVLGVMLMRFDITVSDAQVGRAVRAGSMTHQMSTHSVWMLPVFLAAIVPVLWWRRGVLTVTAISTAVMVVHVALFGWVTRCGAGLPLAFVLTFLGAMVYDRAKAWLVAGLATALVASMLVRDTSVHFATLAYLVPVLLIVFGVGRAAHRRVALGHDLEQRDAELRRLRDEGAALKVSDDRTRVSDRLDRLLRERLDHLTAAAESANGLAPEQTRALLASIEASSRETLEDMREIVGLLRGGDVVLAPTPSMAHLDALLARHQSAGSRLSVTGNPRSLPATVELSAYRIVEHLLTALTDRAGVPVDVVLRFTDDALEIQVSGPAGKNSDLKAALARARERAKLLGGTVEMKVAREQANAIAQLPVLG